MAFLFVVWDNSKALSYSGLGAKRGKTDEFVKDKIFWLEYIIFYLQVAWPSGVAKSLSLTSP